MLLKSAGPTFSAGATQAVSRHSGLQSLDRWSAVGQYDGFEVRSIIQLCLLEKVDEASSDSLQSRQEFTRERATAPYSPLEEQVFFRIRHAFHLR